MDLQKRVDELLLENAKLKVCSEGVQCNHNYYHKTIGELYNLLNELYYFLKLNTDELFMENNSNGLWKKLKFALGKEDQEEEPEEDAPHEHDYKEDMK